MMFAYSMYDINCGQFLLGFLRLTLLVLLFPP